MPYAKQNKERRKKNAAASIRITLFVFVLSHISFSFFLFLFIHTFIVLLLYSLFSEVTTKKKRERASRKVMRRYMENADCLERERQRVKLGVSSLKDDAYSRVHLGYGIRALPKRRGSVNKIFLYLLSFFLLLWRKVLASPHAKWGLYTFSSTENNKTNIYSTYILII